MNWTAILSAVLKYAENNPQAVESLIGAIINLFAANPVLLTKAVEIGLKHAEVSLPKEA